MLWWFHMRNNQKMHIQFCKLIILSVASYIFRPPTVAFIEHLPEDRYSRCPKHFGSYANYYIIYLHICICICWLFLIRYVRIIIVVRGKLGIYIIYMICQCQLVVWVRIKSVLKYKAFIGDFLNFYLGKRRKCSVKFVIFVDPLELCSLSDSCQNAARYKTDAHKLNQITCCHNYLPFEFYFPCWLFRDDVSITQVSGVTWRVIPSEDYFTAFIFFSWTEQKYYVQCMSHSLM